MEEKARKEQKRKEAQAIVDMKALKGDLMGRAIRRGLNDSVLNDLRKINPSTATQESLAEWTLKLNSQHLNKLIDTLDKKLEQKGRPSSEEEKYGNVNNEIYFKAKKALEKKIEEIGDP